MTEPRRTPVAEPRRTPVAEGLFEETGAGVRLLGSRCAGCGAAAFPRAAVCRNPDCRDDRMGDAAFGSRGKLWSFAIQNYPPPAPALHDTPYHPYAIGIVDLDDGLRVVGRMRVDAPETLQIDGEVELVVAPIGRDAEGSELVTWMFEPR